MKQPVTFLRSLLLAMALGFGCAAQAQTTYTQVPLTAASFTADVVANGAAALPPASSATADVDGASFYLISQDYYTASIAHTSGLPNNGAIPNSIAGLSALTYQLASLSANNSLRLQGSSSGTVTFATPRSASDVYVLGLSGSGISTIDVTVTYADNTTTVFSGQTYPDWFTVDANRNVFGATGRGSATVPVSTPYAAAGTAPFLSQLRLVIPSASLNKNISSLTFAKTTATGGATTTLNIMAVSVGVTPLCTAPPTNLTAVASTTAAGGTALTSACSGTNIYLSATGVPTNAGYTYQWQSSTTSATTGFTNISGATSSTYTATGQAVTTYYRVLVSCQFSTAAATASSAVQVTQSPLTACYCTPTYSSGGTGDYVARVRLGTLDNNTAAAGNVSPYYTNYTPQQTGTAPTLQIPTLAKGSTATVTLDFGPDGTQRSAVWIDFDQDGTFSTTEYFTTNTSVGGNGTTTITVTVPATALTGQTRMRVRGGDDSQPTAAQACGASSSSFGEAEDYLVNIGTGCTPTTATFSYGSATGSFCASSTTNPTVTLGTGSTAGTFTSTTGLTLNATTGAITLSSSMPGTYTVTNTVAASGANCASSATTTVTLTAPPTAGFSYGSGPYCVSSGTSPAPTLAAGATAGTFTSTTGLTIAINGTITPSSSTPGTYTVTNTVAASGGCAAVISTATIVINAAPTAGFSYPTAPRCAGTAATVTPTLAAGATAGTYSLPTATGLSISPTTGVITVAATAVAGTYTVTNTVAAANGCAAVTSTASFIISALPATPTLTASGTSATGITLTSSSATGNQFYLNGAPVSGATGQTLLVNSGNGNGAYTVTVTNAASCSATSAPVTVTVTASAVAASTSLTLYPNPSHDGHLTLELRGYQQAVALEVLNTLGQRVYAGAVNGTSLSQQQALDLSALPAGVYLLQVRPADGSLETRRFVRE